MEIKRARRQRPQVLRFPTEIYWLQCDRELLRRRIAERVEAMLKGGWLEEVQGLLKQGVDPRRLEIRPIGYAELAAVVVGDKNLVEAKGEIIARTQAYAKRQDTFFRGMFAHPAYQEAGSRLHKMASYPQAIS